MCSLVTGFQPCALPICIVGGTGPLSGMRRVLFRSIVLGVVAWLVATVVRVVVHKVLGATSLDEKLVDADRPKRPPLSRTMGDVAYWLVLLLFLQAIVGTLHIDALTAPLSNMISGMLGMLPNLIAAAVLGVVGWIVARVVREVVTNLLVATPVDRFTQETEDTRGIRLSQLGEIGRESCRERVRQDGSLSVVAGSFKKKHRVDKHAGT